MVLEGVRKQFGVTWEEILLFRGRTRERVERSIALLEEMWRRRRREMDQQMQGPAHLQCGHIGVPIGRLYPRRISSWLPVLTAVFFLDLEMIDEISLEFIKYKRELYYNFLFSGLVVKSEWGGNGKGSKGSVRLQNNAR